MNALDQFESYRRLLFSIAYRMLGSAMEAEDMVQETFLRYQATPLESIRSPKAFLATVITRLCLSGLESARVQRETYLGPWLPKPILTGANETLDPSDQATFNESVSIAFLVLLESLTPLERAVFLLREVFDFEYAEIAEMVGKEEPAIRQIFSRSKKHITEHRPRFKTSPDRHREMLNRFVQAASAGELDGMVQLLAEDVTMWADGGGKARGAAIRPLYGREAVARFLLASTRLPEESYHAEFVEMNGESSVILRAGSRAFLAVFIAVGEGQIREIRIIGNPDKLRSLQ